MIYEIKLIANVFIAPLKFYKCIQHFVGAHDEAPSVAAMCINNPDRSTFGINGGNPAQAKSCFAEIIRDDFPIFHSERLSLII